LRGEHERVLDACQRSPELAREVSLAVRDGLIDGVVNWGEPGWPPMRTWQDDQDGVVALGRLSGPAERELAGGLLYACDRQRPRPQASSGYRPNRIHEQTFGWWMDVIPDLVAETIKDLGAHRHGTFDLARWLRALPGRDAARWLVRMVEATPDFADLLNPPRLDEAGRTWDAREWIEIFNAFADARFDPRPPRLWIPQGKQKPGPETGPSQVHLACTYADARDDFLLTTVAANLRSYRSGDPSLDAALAWWEPADDRQRKRLYWLLEQSGPPDSVVSLAEAAQEQGLANESLVEFLRAESEHRPPLLPDLDPSRRIDTLVRDLFAELEALDLPIPSQLDYLPVLDEIDRAIAPATLPSSVRRFWELVNPNMLRAIVYPEPATAEFGLESWRMNEEDRLDPRHFFQICYSSHDVLAVECDGPDWTGGCLFEWFISDDAPFQLRFRSVEDWLETTVVALREGAYERGDGYASLDTDRLGRIAEERLTSHDPHPDYGTETTFSRDSNDWSEIWRSRSARIP
jgi:hypothetical protein